MCYDEKNMGQHKRLKRIYYSMRSRCYNPKHLAYHRYGGRGIKICEEWQTFGAFEKWSLSHGYEDDLSIDRIDNDKGYSPENCRWANQVTQNRNRVDNKWLTFNGETKLVSEWGLTVGKSVNTVRERLRRGWSIEDALTVPAKKSGYKQKIKPQRRGPTHIRKITVDGTERSIAATARDYHVSYMALYHRILKGQEPQDAVYALLSAARRS